MSNANHGDKPNLRPPLPHALAYTHTLHGLILGEVFVVCPFKQEEWPEILHFCDIVFISISP